MNKLVYISRLASKAWHWGKKTLVWGTMTFNDLVSTLYKDSSLVKYLNKVLTVVEDQILLLKRMDLTPKQRLDYYQLYKYYPAVRRVCALSGGNPYQVIDNLLNRQQ